VILGDAAAEELAFSPVEASGLREWRRPTRFDWAEKLGLLPIADTELLNLSHYCPIAIAIGAGGPSVVCVLQRSHLRTTRIAPDGRWLPAYAPLALRTMPFRMRIQRGARIVEVAALPEQAGGEGEILPFLTEGKPSRDYAAILGLLENLAKGSARLMQAARVLMAADLLVPIALDVEDVEASTLMAVSSERLFQLPPARAAALTVDSCLPFDLAAASVFSRRWLVDGIIRERPVVAMEAVATAVAQVGILDHGLRDAIEQPLELDASALFSFDEFIKVRRSDE
jgi:hypothetical protein